MEKNSTPNQPRALLKKYLQGECSPDEELKVLNWYRSLGKNDFIELNDHDLKKLSQQIKRKTLEIVVNQRHRSSIGTWANKRTFFIRTAAILLIFLLTGIVLYHHYVGSLLNQSYPVLAQPNEERDILIPTDSFPSLRLPNGQVTLLGQNPFQKLKDDAVVLRKEGADVVYEVQHNTMLRHPSDLTNETLVFSNPKGYKNKLLLGDGSIVWLNSGASLEYPIAFKKEFRRVKLIGEAYFEIAHEVDRPFYVDTKQAEISVLGTIFNISAYPDQGTTTTSLIQGAVRLTTAKSKVTLKAGDQYATDDKGVSTINKGIDLSDLTSWKDGYFSFSNAEIADILEKLGRWYNIQEINYVKKTDEKITGTFQQTNSLRDLLDRLEEVSDLKFEIRGRRLMVL